MGKVTINRKEELVNNVKLAVTSLEDGDYDDAEQYMRSALQIEPDCRDAWLIKSALDAASDAKLSATDRDRASNAKVDLGLFSAEDAERLAAKPKKDEAAQIQKSDDLDGTSVFFIVAFFFVGFFGFALSLAAVMMAGTYVPLYVTVGLIVLLLVLFAVTRRKRRALPDPFSATFCPSQSALCTHMSIDGWMIALTLYGRPEMGCL